MKNGRPILLLLSTISIITLFFPWLSENWKNDNGDIMGYAGTVRYIFGVKSSVLISIVILSCLSTFLGTILKKNFILYSSTFSAIISGCILLKIMPGVCRSGFIDELFISPYIHFISSALISLLVQGKFQKKYLISVCGIALFSFIFMSGPQTDYNNLASYAKRAKVKTVLEENCPYLGSFEWSDNYNRFDVIVGPNSWYGEFTDITTGNNLHNASGSVRNNKLLGQYGHEIGYFNSDCSLEIKTGWGSYSLEHILIDRLSR